MPVHPPLIFGPLCSVWQLCTLLESIFKFGFVEATGFFSSKKTFWDFVKDVSPPSPLGRLGAGLFLSNLTV